MIVSQSYACIAKGSQKLAQGKGSTNAHFSDVGMCVMWLENVETDLLITLSIPHRETNHGEGVWAEHSDVFKEVLTGLESVWLSCMSSIADAFTKQLMIEFTRDRLVP